jgi:hypothetical protein
LSADETGAASRFVELVWPGKDRVKSVSQESGGLWALEEQAPSAERVHAIVSLERYPTDAVAPRSILIRGQRLVALKTLARAQGRFVRLAYLDLPRIGVDDSEAAFQGDPAIVYSTWLSVVRTHIQAVEPLMRRDGVLVLHAGDGEQAYARLIANELFRGQHIGSVVWQRAYAPRNMPGMREFTATHDCLLIYAKDKSSLPPVGLRRPPEGFSNSDNDPRGPWKAEHKGAKTRRENSDFDTFVPPYRWTIVDGRLPEGVWRLSPLTGVMWGKELKEAGTFQIVVEVSDSAGATANQSLVIEVLDGGPTSTPPALPWILKEIDTTGPLRIETKSLPKGMKGGEYMAACLGAGGKPFKAPPKRPGSGRYWEFARDTLLAAYQHDSVYLGREEPTAIPHPKQYEPPEGELVVENQQTWWPGRIGAGASSVAFAGYTEDATKHLKALKELNLLTAEVSSAKPEYLISRLIEIFTDTDDTVLEVFGQSGDIAAVALKRHRNFVTLTGASDRDDALFKECALPRLQAVVDGKDSGLAEKVSEIRMRSDAYIPFTGGGSFAIGTVGPWIVERQRKEEIASLNWAEFAEPPNLIEGLLTAEGFLPYPASPSEGLALDGGTVAFALQPDEFLTSELAAEIAARMIDTRKKATIYYFRASTDFDPTALPDGIACKRVPFDLGI